MMRLVAQVLMVVWPQLVHANSWESPQTPNIDPSEWGLTGIQASDCGVCHTDIYAEWKLSTHAAAWVDPQFQGELHKDPDVGWLCLNCHTPVANQQALIVQETGVVRAPKTAANPAFDEAYRNEGVTCMGCHWRPDGIAAPHANVKAPHTTVYAPDMMEDGTCLDCHQARARLEDALVCDFNTGNEKTSAGVTRSCSSCHMPTVERAMATGGAVRSGGRHSWAGSGIGKGIGPTHPGLDGLDVSFTVAPVVVGEPLEMRVSLHNVRAGHPIPTGDPERMIRVDLRMVDAAGVQLAQHTERFGQTWQWSPVAMKLSDNRIGVGEQRWVEWSQPMPAGPVDVEVTVRHIRLSAENLRYHIDLVKDGRGGPSIAALQAYPTERVLFSQISRIEPVSR
jgi:hypothetical protein